MTLAVRGYEPSDVERWDDLIRRSRNGTFLFLRDYMDYHADRFPDASLLAVDVNGKVHAVLPACSAEDVVSSHAGLTYGGFVVDESITATTMVDLLDAAISHLNERGFTRLFYKTIPHIYHVAPTEEDRYALFLRGAQLIRRDLLTVVPTHGSALQERRKRAVKRAQRAGVHVRLSKDFGSFWPILEDNLHERHDVRPVHTLDEITMLAARFPDNIRLFAAHDEHEMLAGVVTYETTRVRHVQYSAASHAGRSRGALDAILAVLLADTSARFFDFGVSTERAGQTLNTGLVEYKEGFGGRGIVQDFYELHLS